MTTTPANDAAAVIAALEYYTESTYVTNWGMQEEADNGDMARAGRTAFAAILDRLQVVEAENFALRAFVGIPDGVTVASVEQIMALPVTFGLPIETLVKAAQRSTKPVIRIVDSESKSPD